MIENYTFAEGHTLAQICYVWECGPQNIIFIPEYEHIKPLWQHTASYKLAKADLGNSQITDIEIGSNETMFGCNNCGASSLVGANHIRHHTECKPGEAEYWADFYSEEVEGGD